MLGSHRKVCVVGGGPAGLAAAIALKRENCHVTVVDCAIPPVDKTCGEGLMPDSIAALAELGIEIPAGIGFAFQGIRFADPWSSVFADFPNGIARGLRRTVLHKVLIQHATRLGISILWGAKHVRLREGRVSVDGRLIEAAIVVGADGQNSQIRRQAALDQIRRETRRYDSEGTIELRLGLRIWNCTGARYRKSTSRRLQTMRFASRSFRAIQSFDSSKRSACFRNYKNEPGMLCRFRRKWVRFRYPAVCGPSSAAMSCWLAMLRVQWTQSRVRVCAWDSGKRSRLLALSKAEIFGNINCSMEL